LFLSMALDYWTSIVTIDIRISKFYRTIATDAIYHLRYTHTLQRPLAVIPTYPVPPFMNGSTAAVHPNSLDENAGIFLT